MNERICKYCGCYEDDHNYEHMARQCFPEQIEILQKRIEELEKHSSPSLPVDAQVIRPIRFFCPECGKEMWELTDYERHKDETIDGILRLLSVGCNDCILKNYKKGV